MPLKKCKECGKQISSKADACPHCGFKKKGKGCLVLFVLGILTIIILWSAMDDMPEMYKDPSTAKTVDISINSTTTEIQITNLSSSEAVGKFIEIRINDYSARDGFVGDFIMPEVGKSVGVPYGVFVRGRDNAIFNPRTTAVSEIWVGGGGYDYKGYGN